MLTFRMIITGRSICSVNGYGENNGFYLYVVLPVIVTITGKSICSVNSYCDNNGRSIYSVNSYCDNNG